MKKELSIEEKAKRYDESLEKARKLKDEYNDIEGCYSNQWLCEELFPELAESEDERIRKELIDYFKENNAALAFRGISNECVIAWLEKQGEQKPQGKSVLEAAKEEKIDNANKVEPKFKVGDWVIGRATNNEPRQISEVTKQCYRTTYGGQYGFSFEDEMHLWTIQDARDGDVLSFNDGHGNDCIELIKSITSKKIEFWFCLTNGNRYEVFDGIIPYTNLASREDATPATKEQRALLFQKMKEAGYEWDAEKNELKKIDQKPAWNEEDENALYELIGFVENWKAKAKDFTKKLTLWSCDESKCDVLLSFLKSLRPQNRWKPSNEQMEALEHFIVYHNGSTNYAKDLEELRQQLMKLIE